MRLNKAGDRGKKRIAGTLLHLSSLPSEYGIGDIGKGAYAFLDWLEEAGLKAWQMLPISPTGYGNSPYSSYSVFAAHHLYISLEQLQQVGLLPSTLPKPHFSETRAQYHSAEAYKLKYLKEAFTHFKHYASQEVLTFYEHFKQENIFWLNKYASFMSLKEAHGHKAWYEWTEEHTEYDIEMAAKGKYNSNDMAEFHMFIQYVFFGQWSLLRQHAHKKGIILIGDMPIYAAHDSADVWGEKELFTIDKKGMPKTVAGVPPDYFSENGQLWGNPLYEWEIMRNNNFEWWKKRFHRQLSLFDYVRVDHFRGFESYWEIDGKSHTAKNGMWKKAPGKLLFQELLAEFGSLPVIAEDLGIITDEVRELRDYFSFPGMKVLQFGFDSCDVHNEFLPHNFSENYVCYTGTHDNDTTLGWLNSSDERISNFIRNYTKKKKSNENVRALIEMAFASVAQTVIVPMQDILGQGSKYRMNTPGKSAGNWEYRIRYKDLTEKKAMELRRYVQLYAR